GKTGAVIDFLGQPQVEIREREQVVTTTISATALAEHRARFPAMLDADRFEIGD
ncbi:amidohydrolase, partial [Xanthomonas perforans]